MSLIIYFSFPFLFLVDFTKLQNLFELENKCKEISQTDKTSTNKRARYANSFHMTHISTNFYLSLPIDEKIAYRTGKENGGVDDSPLLPEERAECRSLQGV